MRMPEASAPGKVMLSGEYAVLRGAPAIVAAVDHRAVARVDACEGATSSVTAPGFSEHSGRFEWQDGRVNWLEAGDDFALLEAVLDAGQPTFSSSVCVSLDTSAFHAAGGAKLGLGSSAALCAAIATALDDTVDLAPALVAMSAHRNFQSGRGSGADVAASLAGGVIDYRMEESGWTCLDWPEGLHYRLYYSGTSASTPDKIRSFDSIEVGAEFDELVALSNEIAERFREPTVFGLLGAFARYADALRTFDVVSGLGIYANGHAIMADRARAGQLIYKPCGAGGGDIGIALAHDVDLLEAFDGDASELGFEPMDARIDQNGARLST